MNNFVLCISILFFVTGCASHQPITNQDVLTSTSKPVTITPAPGLTPSITLTSTPFLVPSPTYVPTVQSLTNTPNTFDLGDDWIVYLNQQHGFRLEYPKLYDFPAKVPMYDEYVECAPRLLRSSPPIFEIGDWIQLSIRDLQEGATPMPFSGVQDDWIIDFSKEIATEGIHGYMVEGRSPSVIDNDGTILDTYFIGFAQLWKDNRLAIFRYSSTISGTPPCMYNYPVPDLFVHIVDSFEFIN